MSLLYLIKHLYKSAIQFGLCDPLQEPVHAKVNDTVTQRTGLSAQCAGQVAFTAAGGAGDEDIFCTVNKQPVSKSHELI